ncbi:M15 family metallopeptidase [Microseira sp. BLCC-F43]|jgi:D-alanyl-D-alanine dipeptidase|uniref:M15 family metallopeptidase n=1 Tax=Microseira sp. BLCC-F43 TaxID=3153602 RepID=UPI0035B7E99C
MIRSWARAISFILLVALYISCQKSDFIPIATSATPPRTVFQTDSTKSNNIVESQVKNKTQLIDIPSVNPNIVLDIRYATQNNFTKRRLYPVARCLLRASVARKLSLVQQDLEKQSLGLKVYDCYRPLSVQRQMWRLFPNPRYVANPAIGSRHNRGAAVDVTLVDRNGDELEMPTEFDNFTVRAHINYSGGSSRSRRNRQILQNSMKQRGFMPMPSEWWHFDGAGWENFSVLDLPLESSP